MADPAFTWTALYRPRCELGLGDPRAAEPTSWLDISCYVHEAELFRGHERFTERFQPGTATAVFKNTNGWADLVGTGAAIAAKPLRPGRPIRFGIEGVWDGVASVAWLWRGYIDQAKPAYDPVEEDIVTVTCVDALGEAGSSTVDRIPFTGHGETVNARLNRVLDAANWFPTKRAIAASTVQLQGTELGGRGIDLLGQAADSAGGVVYGETDGNVVFRGFDWAYYDSTAPPDGSIGNVGEYIPGIPFTPAYIDPGEGTVSWPDPPPLGDPTTFVICAQNVGDGVLLEQGAELEVYVRDGHLYYANTDTVFDLGHYEGGCVAIEDCNDGEPPTRYDNPGGDDDDDTWEISPFPPIEIPDPPADVELIYFTDQGMAQPHAASVTPGPIRPGPGCVIVVLFNAIGTESVPETGLAATISGGGLDWVDVHHRDAPDVGASGWVWAAEVGRDDPGLFSLSLAWDGEISQHICTVWKVTHTLDGFIDRCVDGSVLEAVTNSNLPFEIEPGKGPQSVALESREGVRLPPTTVDEITIAQSLADEIEPPYGAVFDDAEGTWIVPTSVNLPTVLAAEFSDNFDGRPDGPLGPPDYAALPAPPTYRVWVPVMVVDGHGEWTGYSEVGVSPTPAAGEMINIPIDGNQTIEVSFSHVGQRVIDIELYAQIQDTTDLTCVGVYFEFRTDIGAGNNIIAYGIDGTGGFGPDVPTWGGDGYFESGVTIPDPSTVRFEADAGGACRAFLNDVLLFEGPATFDPGPNVGFAITKTEDVVGGDDGTTPWIESVAASSGGLEHRASWVAGYRPDSVASNVAWTEVNIGTADVQSTQAAIVTEHGPASGGLVIGGSRIPPTGGTTGGTKITDVVRYDGCSITTPGEIIWRFDPGETPLPGSPWVVSGPGVIVPGTDGTPGVAGDVCPQGWELDFDRAQMSTLVHINHRSLPPPDPAPHLTLADSTGAPLPGQITMNATDQRLATYLYISLTAIGGLDLEWYLRNLSDGATITLADQGHDAEPIVDGEIEAQINSSDGLRWTFRAVQGERDAADYDWVTPDGNPSAAPNRESVSVVYGEAGPKTVTLNVAAGAGPPAGGSYSTTIDAVEGATSASIAYRVTGPTTSGGTYAIVPVACTGTRQIRDGDVEMTIAYFAEPPRVFIDTFGRAHYGDETFVRDDLIRVEPITDTVYQALADRILEIRGSNSVPRVDAVTIDARTSPDEFPARNAELMVKARPEKPSRYRLRLMEADGRQIFDRLCFATTVRHFIRHDEWTVRISFDVAEWAGVP